MARQGMLVTIQDIHILVSDDAFTENEGTTSKYIYFFISGTASWVVEGFRVENSKYLEGLAPFFIFGPFEAWRGVAIHTHTGNNGCYHSS